MMGSAKVPTPKQKGGTDVSKQKNTPPSTPAAVAEVDWAEKLKASMNDTSFESSPAAAPTSEDDDLAALLRAQLSKSGTSATPAEVSDTAGFMEYAEQSDEEISEETLDTESFDDEEENNEFFLEESDDYAYSENAVEENEDDCAEYNEAKSEQEDNSIEMQDEHAESYESFEQNEDDSESTEDIFDEYEKFDKGSDDLQEGPAEKIGLLDSFESDEYIKGHAPEEYHDFLPRSKPVSPSAPPPVATRATPTAYRPPSVEAWTDDRLNGVHSRRGMGGDRLQELALKNQHLVEEVRAVPYAPVADDPVAATPRSSAPTPTGEVIQPEAPAPRPRSPRVSRLYAPLQLGLDDISPTVKRDRTSVPAEETTLPASEPSLADYTARMADKPAEETALQDTELYMHLGYGETLRRTDEQMRAEQIATRADEGGPCRASGEYPSVDFAREYRGREDTDTLEEAYLTARRKNVARLVVAAMGAFVGILYDLLPALGFRTAADTPLYIPLGLVWTLLIALPFLPRLGRGIQSLLEFEPTRYCVSAVALSVAMLHGIAAWVMRDPYRLPLFGGVALLMLTVAALSELLTTEGEYAAFAVAASGKTTYLPAEGLTPAASALRAVQKRDTDPAAPPKRKLFTVVRAGRVADYLARTNRYNPYMGRLNYLLPAALLAAIACAGLEAALGGDLLTDCLRVFTSAYMICLPSAYLMAMSLPLAVVNRRLCKKGTAVLGAAAPADYAEGEGPTLIFSDGDALRPLCRKDITLRGDTETEEYCRMADATFRLLGNALAVEPVLRDGDIDHFRIEISETDEQYLRLYLVDTEKNSTTEIMMGSHSALTRRGIRLPKISMEQRYKKSEGSHVLYLAFNRRFHLAYALEYRVSHAFANAALELTAMGCRVALASYDPMVSRDTACIARLRKTIPVEILRPVGFESVRRSRSGALIATGRSTDLVLPLHACRAMGRAYRRASLLQWLSLPVGLALVVLAVCLGSVGLLTSATVALWQILLSGVTIWVALASVKRRNPSSTPRPLPQEKGPGPEQDPLPSDHL